MRAKDYYGILEVSPRACDEVIQAAYSALLGKYSPNEWRSGIGAEVDEAFAALSDLARREAYDASRNHLEEAVVGDRYRVIEKIAQGSFGTTYRAEHILSGETVCIKQCNKISPESEAILLDETKIMGDLRHTAIPAVRDLIRLPDGSLALVMSFIPGLPLDKQVQEYGKMDPEHVTWITERALNALMYMHYHGVVHGDIKPQNTIIQKDHSIVIVDFGLAMLKPPLNAGSKGFTPLFASPEGRLGERITPKSDFYSLGLTACWALNGGSIEMTERRSVPDTTPAPLRHFLARLTREDPAERPSWQGEDLGDTIVQVRKESFGRTRSGMKPIPGLD